MGMSLQLEWQYLQRNVPGAGSMIGPIEYSLRYAFFHVVFGREEVIADLKEILGRSVKRGGLGIPYLVFRRSVLTTPPKHPVRYW